MKSLLIVGYPKGFTSATYSICRRATGLRETGISEGELLNWQRNRAIEPFPFVAAGEAAYRCYAPYLHRVRQDHIVKDVVQPHVVLRYVEEHPAHFRILYIHRDPDDVMRLHRRAGWTYYPDPRNFVDAFRQFPTVHYERAIEDPEALFAPLRALGYRVRAFDYRNEAFCRRREESRKRLAMLHRSDPLLPCGEEGTA